ncbi:MAG: DNA translocase FtsK [Paludibacteraceae bacterium]|nr:DNA translocase FtsK [Paludibacteraceae bacterium]
MPRTSSKSGGSVSERREERAIKVEQESWWQACKRVLTDRRTRMIIGVVLLCFSIVALLAYISYLFTGTADQSVLSMDHAGRVENREAIRNMLGLPGARLAHFLIDGAFGFVSVLLLLMIAIYGLRLMHVFKDIHAIKLFCGGAFWVLWGAVVLGFAQQMVHLGVFRWGGAFGAASAAWLVSYVNIVGTIAILLVTLVIFLIVTDPRFIDRCKAFGLWLKGLFKKKEKPVSDVSLEGEEGDAVTLDLPIDGEDIAEGPQGEGESISFTIENPENPDDPAMPEVEIEDPQPEPEPLVDENGEPLGDAPLIEDPTALQPAQEEKGDKDPDLKIEDVNVDDLYTKDPDKLLEKLGPYDPRKDLEFYKFPSLNLLKVYDNEAAPVINEEEQRANGARIVTTLRNYGIEIESIKATVGPTVTLYEIVPKAGVRVAKIQALENDIMLSLSATGIRIIAPMPGKGTIGIEVPNEKPQVVSMHSVIASKRFQEETKMRLPIAYGRTITNEVFMFDLAKTPHLLVAGATGTGKSVAINAIITSLLYKKHPAELKLVMVDPKMVEFAPYKPLLKHFLAAQPDTDPEQVVITDCDKVINTLNSLVIEMENRYKLLMDAGVRNLEDYNDKFVRRRLNPNKLVGESLHHQYLPYIVIIIDEYGDFIMQAGKQVETPIARITQKARAVGMHMILATQRPSVNIVTGVIKANIPTRIALRTQSVIDSRTVLDAKGAEQLIGRGDSLYAGNASITRVQCAFVDTPEVDEIVKHISKQQRYTEPYQLPEYVGEGGEGEALAPGSVDMKRLDPMFADVARYVVTKQEGSTSRLQRAFEIGYNRAGKLSDQLEAAGIVGPNKGPKGRDVLIQDLSQLDQLLEELGIK